MTETESNKRVAYSLRQTFLMACTVIKNYPVLSLKFTNMLYWKKLNISMLQIEIYSINKKPEFLLNLEFSFLKKKNYTISFCVFKTLPKFKNIFQGLFCSVNMQLHM